MKTEHSQYELNRIVGIHELVKAYTNISCEIVQKAIYQSEI